MYEQSFDVTKNISSSYRKSVSSMRVIDSLAVANC
jgi:hypothetical protein